MKVSPIFVRVLAGVTLFALMYTATQARAADEPDWQPVLAELLKSEKPGYGGLCGVVVDHKTGSIWVNLSDKGIYCSSSGTKEFKRVSDKQPKGRTETPGCLMIDPAGKSKSMVIALVYGSPIGISPDHGETWKFLDNKSGHVDWCAVDWTDPDMKFILALKHESGGQLIASNDGGKTFRDVGKGYGPAWIFDNQTAVVVKGGLLRTTDGAKTFKPVADYKSNALPKWRNGTLYWLVDGALIATTDKGENWKKLSDLKGGQYGPIFGKDAKHMFVLTNTGIVESTDGGATWSKPIPQPKELKEINTLTWIEYDPKSELLYIMKMGSDLYKLTRGK